MALAGKNRNKQIEYFDEIHGCTLSIDSMEENDFLNWLTEAVQLSVVNDFVYQPGSFSLYDSETYVDVDGKTKCLFRDHVYSPDFLVSFDPNAQKQLAREFRVRQSDLSAPEVSAWIDTKGLFNMNGRSFSTDRKWVWQKFKVYICEVVPKKFSQKFGVAVKSFYTRKTGKSRKMYAGCKTIAEALGLKRPPSVPVEG